MSYHPTSPQSHLLTLHFRPSYQPHDHSSWTSSAQVASPSPPYSPTHKQSSSAQAARQYYASLPGVRPDSPRAAPSDESRRFMTSWTVEKGQLLDRRWNFPRYLDTIVTSVSLHKNGVPDISHQRSVDASMAESLRLLGGVSSHDCEASRYHFRSYTGSEIYD